MSRQTECHAAGTLRNKAMIRECHPELCWAPMIQVLITQTMKQTMHTWCPMFSPPLCGVTDHVCELEDAQESKPKTSTCLSSLTSTWNTEKRAQFVLKEDKKEKKTLWQMCVCVRNVAQLVEPLLSRHEALGPASGETKHAYNPSSLETEARGQVSSSSSLTM